MAELMVGRKLVQIKNANSTPIPNKPILEVKNLDITSILKRVSIKNKDIANKINNRINFKINAGEVFAVAGVEGNGQSELAQMISGLMPLNSSAEIIINDHYVTNKSINVRYKAGLSHVPEDRHKHGLILDDTIAMNAVLQQVDSKKFSSFGF